MSADQHSYLARNNMKRSSYPKSHPQSKIQRPANKGYHNNPEFINVVMQQVIKVFVPDLKMNISPISGSSRVLQVQNRPATQDSRCKRIKSMNSSIILPPYRTSQGFFTSANHQIRTYVAALVQKRQLTLVLT